MTITELKNQVIALGFETTLESESAFISATNRAILEVNDIQPKLSYFSVTQNNQENLINTGDSMFDIIQHTDTDLEYEAIEPKAYYFECDGNGTAYIEKYNTATEEWDITKTITLTSSRKFVVYKGLISSTTDDVFRIRFSGSYIYNIRHIAAWAFLYSALEADIPYLEPYVRYDINTLVDDFLGFDKTIIKESSGETFKTTNYKTEGNSVVLIDYTYSGQFNIWYKAYPTAITINDDQDATEIDLPEDLANALPLLVAHYIWLDEKPDMSARYYDLYTVRAEELRNIKRVEQGTFSFTNTKGWA